MEVNNKMTITCDKINLKKGSKGEDVKELQTILQNKGYYVGRIDGYYGDMTLNAVIRLQKAQGNTPDGWFGKKTCQKLHQTSGASKTVTKNSTNSNNCAGQKFSKNELYNAGQTLKKHIGNNDNYPNYITMTALDGVKYDVPRSIYMGLLEGRNLFAIRRGRLPNWVQANSTANNPLCFDHQNNAYNCGPTSLSMCMQMMGEYIPENQLAREAGTTRNGTGPAQLKAVAKKHGYTLTEINRNSLAVNESLKKCRPVLMHINTAYAGGRSCLGYIHRYGHYIMCYRVNSNGSYELCDPTKGFKTCRASSIDNARSGSFMKYYSLSVD